MQYAGMLYGLEVFEDTPVIGHSLGEIENQLLSRLRQFARDELDRNGLSDWKFELQSSERIERPYIWTMSDGQEVWGNCSFRSRRISVNVDNALKYPCFELWKNVVLHEVAHALSGYGAGHGVVWRIRCALLGAYPSEYSNSTPLYKKIFSSGFYVSPNDYIIDTCQHGKFELLIAALLETMIPESWIMKVLSTLSYFRRMRPTWQNIKNCQMGTFVHQTIGKGGFPEMST